MKCFQEVTFSSFLHEHFVTDELYSKDGNENELRYYALQISVTSNRISPSGCRYEACGYTETPCLQGV
jgi:hypothetical protein